MITEKIVIDKLQRNFTRAVRISDNNYIIKGFDSTYKNQILYNVNFSTGGVISKTNLLDRKNDAGLSIDGSLLYDSATHCVIYVHSYCNKILYMDTTLNLLHIAKTIDTFSAYQLSGKEITINKHKSFFTQSKPPRFVNNKSCLYDGKLYVNSAIRADNETEEAYNKNSLIDIYTLGNNQYVGSFYIPKYKKEKLLDFFFSNNFIVATYPDRVIIYK